MIKQQPNMIQAGKRWVSIFFLFFLLALHPLVARADSRVYVNGTYIDWVNTNEAKVYDEAGLEYMCNVNNGQGYRIDLMNWIGITRKEINVYGYKELNGNGNWLVNQKPDNLDLEHGKPIFDIRSGGTLTTENVTIYGANELSTSSTVVVETGGTINVKNGTAIMGSKHWWSAAKDMYCGGHGIWGFTGSAINMLGGELCNNDEAGIGSNGATVTISGGTIYNNRNNGVSSYGTLTMTGGVITGNTGEGIFMGCGTATIYGGEIASNASDGIGVLTGSVQVISGSIHDNARYGIHSPYSDGTIVLNGGSIYCSQAGIAHSGTLTMSGGVIYSCSTGISSFALMQMSGGTIQQCTNGIYKGAGNAVITNGTFAQNMGHDIYHNGPDGTTFQIENGTGSLSDSYISVFLNGVGKYIYTTALPKLKTDIPASCYTREKVLVRTNTDSRASSINTTLRLDNSGYFTKRNVGNDIQVWDIYTQTTKHVRYNISSSWEPYIPDVSSAVWGGNGYTPVFATPPIGYYNYALTTESPSIKEPIEGSSVSVTVNADNVFYACYKPQKYTVYFDANIGVLPYASVSDLTATLTSKTVVYGDHYGDLPVPALYGARFDGWFTSSVGGAQIIASTLYQTAGNSTLFAHWTDITPPTIDNQSAYESEINPYTLTFHTNDVGGSGLATFELHDGSDPLGTLLMASVAINGVNGTLSYDFTEDGEHSYTLVARDNAGNETVSPFTVNCDTMGLTAFIYRNLEPHDPIFANGELGYVKINVKGYVEKVIVTFEQPQVDAALKEGKTLNAEYTLYPQESDSIGHKFFVPLYGEYDTYGVRVTAFKGEKSLEVTPSYTVYGTILDQFRTRIR